MHFVKKILLNTSITNTMQWWRRRSTNK